MFSGMIAAWLNKLAGTKMSYVPYTQMTQGIQDVLSGRVQLVIIAVPTAKGHIAAGKLRPLAVTSLKRLPEFPDVAAVSETTVLRKPAGSLTSVAAPSPPERQTSTAYRLLFTVVFTFGRLDGTGIQAIGLSPSRERSS